MQEESFSEYQFWVEVRIECAKGFRRRKWLLFWKCTGIFLAVSVAILLLCFVAGMGSNEAALAMAAADVAMLFLCIQYEYNDAPCSCQSVQFGNQYEPKRYDKYYAFRGLWQGTEASYVRRPGGL